MSVPTVDPTDTLAVLKAAETWLSDPGHWTRDACWRSADGLPTHQRAAVARTCVVGALSYVVGEDCAVAWPDAAYSELAQSLGVLGDVSVINDGPDGYPRIMAGLRKAIATIESGA